VVALNEETCQGVEPGARGWKCDQHAPGEVFYTEIGVSFDDRIAGTKGAATWFRPFELVVISEQQYEGERLGIFSPPETGSQPRKRARSRS
jgi:hypothetical protein